MVQKTKALDKVKNRSRKLKQEIYVLYLAYRDPRVPWYAKLFTVCVVAYAFSPIDLIPDFIPILGYLDDLIIVPFGIALALKMIPRSVIDDCRIRAEEIRQRGKPKNWIAGALFIVIWILCAFWIGSICYRWVR
ncbi:YkvA family protein [Cohnella laeviribosi]|uniref:YkvA family protein n=1 Tax=Cohnella laeviribosi TaxID=380174 RepID=UPI00036392DA|nr:YkvA family protein [Cohnella laeviribosi]